MSRVKDDGTKPEMAVRKFLFSSRERSTCSFSPQFILILHKKLKHIDFTAIIEKSEDGWYVGQLEELPEVIPGWTIKPSISTFCCF